MTFLKNDKTSTFANELLFKLPRVSSAPQISQSKTQEKNKVEFLKKNESYKLVVEEESDLKKSSKKEDNMEINSIQDKKRKHIRTKDKSAVQEQDEEEKVQAEKKAKVEEIDMEAEYEKNNLEVKEFNEKMKEKNKKDTISKTEEKLSKKAEEEALKRRTLAEKEDFIPDARIVSRQTYLGKREEQKLEEERIALLDETYLFNYDELTAVSCLVLKL